MHAAGHDDDEEPTFVSDGADTILVGLALSDQNLALRIRSMIAQMATVEATAIDDADVIVTDTAPPHAGPYLILHDTTATEPPANGIDRNAGRDVLEAAIRLIAQGYRIVAPARAHRPARSDTSANSGEPLTPREQQVLEKLAAGASNKMIARELDISLATTKFHVASLLAKLGARNRTDAVAIGLRMGLLLL
jgi:DNA-binding CsgD family transcriptional regulator